MILTKINYCEHKNQINYWEIKEVVLDKINLIVGKNATGKTRLLNLISGFARVISKKNKFDGNWLMEFKENFDSENTYKINLLIENQKILNEEIYEKDKLLLKRANGKGKIFSIKNNDFIEYSPPINELTLHVKRDVEEFPYLEKIIEWANNFLGYSFSGVKPTEILIPINPESMLEDLKSVPYTLENVLKKSKLLKVIKENFTFIGYPIEDIKVIQVQMPNLLLISIKEKSLNCEISQVQMSSGMYRALSLIVILESIIEKYKNKCATIVIDDIGEGLDFERSTKLIQLLIKRIENTNIQIIITSNDRFLINSFNIKNINFLERKGHMVQSYNYSNNKDHFDELIFTGLDNFDFLKSEMYQEKQ